MKLLTKVVCLLAVANPLQAENIDTENRLKSVAIEREEANQFLKDSLVFEKMTELYNEFKHLEKQEEYEEYLETIRPGLGFICCFP